MQNYNNEGSTMYESPYANNTYNYSASPEIPNMFNISGDINNSVQQIKTYDEQKMNHIALRTFKSYSKQPKVESNYFYYHLHIVTEKLKVNMGFVSFKKAKNLSPVKF